MQPSTPRYRRSSGNLIADRRFELALAYADDGDVNSAAELLQQVIELVPQWPFAWHALAKMHEALGQSAAAVAAFAETDRLDQNGEIGARLHLARLGAAAAPGTAPEGYIEKLFDQYAGQFETHLVEALNYCGPAQLADAIASCGPRYFQHAIDLGCGTGLCGAAMRSKVARLTGVDLSPQMIAQARAKGLYDTLHVQSLAAFLKTAAPDSADLLLAADVFVYIGDLGPLLRAGHRVLQPAGLFAFTLQTQQASATSAKGFSIGADLRYAHDAAYVTALAERCGYRVLVRTEAAARHEAGVGVSGLVVLLEKF